MSEEERFFKNPVTGELMPDKRNPQKIETILAKVALSQEMTENTIKNIERTQNANSTMLENLIRSEYTALRTELKTHNENNIRDFSQAIKVQSQINKDVKEDIKVINENLANHGERIEVLENKSTKNKAKYFDKIMAAIGGGLLTLLVSYIITVVNAITHTAH